MKYAVVCIFIMVFLVKSSLNAQVTEHAELVPPVKRWQFFVEALGAQTTYKLRRVERYGFDGLNASGQELGLGFEARYQFGQKRGHFVMVNWAYRLRRLKYTILDPEYPLSPPIPPNSNRLVFNKIGIRLGYGYCWRIPLQAKHLGLSASLGLSYEPYLSYKGWISNYEIPSEYLHQSVNQQVDYSYRVSIRAISPKTNYTGIFFALAVEYPIGKRLLRLGFELQEYSLAIEQFAVNYHSARLQTWGYFRNDSQINMSIKLGLGF